MSNDPAAGTREEFLARVDELEAAVSNLDAELDEKIQDVRERVIQVKRETDAKAPEDHDHGDLAGRLDGLEEQVEALGRDYVDLDAAVDRVDEDVESVDERLTAGFENYEAVLEYLVETTDDLNEKLSTLVRAVGDARERVDRIARAEARRAAADELRETGQRYGVSTAACESCGDDVALGLLAAPACPHCASTFTELEPRRGFFRTSVLHTGGRPALEGEVEGRSSDLDSLVADDGPAPPRVGEWSSDGGGELDAARAIERERSAGTIAATDQPVTSISGVGETYAEKLREAGVETVGDLARADPADLAERSDIPTGRLERLVGRAVDRLDGA